MTSAVMSTGWFTLKHIKIKIVMLVISKEFIILFIRKFRAIF